MTNLLEYYRKLYRENSAWIKMATIWFLITSIIGAIVFFVKPTLLDDLLKNFKDQFGPSPKLDYHLVLQIFLKNTIAISFALFGGLILGLTPLFVILVNGILFGFVMASIFAIRPFGNSILLIIGGILPHGIVEIPTFLIASGLGLRLGLEWMGKGARGNRWQVVKDNFRRAFSIWLRLLFFLLIAALIEVYISGRIVDNFR